MSNEVKGGATYELSNDINVITAEINAYQRVAGEAIFEIGYRLKHAKEIDLVHGEWAKWCAESLDITPQYANRYISVYERFANRNPGFSLGKVSLAAMNALIPFDDEELEKPRELPDGTTKSLTEMSRREIEEFKRREKEAIKEKEKAVHASEEAERRATQAEANAKQAQRSEEIALRQLEEFEGRESTVEIRTEYVEVVKRDESLDKRLQDYEARFGAIENYTERTRATNLAEVTTSVMTFSKAVRDLAKRHAYLIQYQDTILALDPFTKREYNEAVTALTELSRDFAVVTESATIIDAEFTE